MHGGCGVWGPRCGFKVQNASWCMAWVHWGLLHGVGSPAGEREGRRAGRWEGGVGQPGAQEGAQEGSAAARQFVSTSRPPPPSPSPPFSPASASMPTTLPGTLCRPPPPSPSPAAALAHACAFCMPTPVRCAAHACALCCPRLCALLSAPVLSWLCTHAVPCAVFAVHACYDG